MANPEKVDQAAGRLARTTQDTFRVLMEHMIGLQERNIRFAQGIVDDSIEEFRRQAESNRAVACRLVDEARERREDYQMLINQSMDAYMDLLYAPFGRYRRGLRAVK